MRTTDTDRSHTRTDEVTMMRIDTRQPVATTAPAARRRGTAALALRFAFALLTFSCIGHGLAAQRDPSPLNLQQQANEQFEDLVERMRQLQLVRAQAASDESRVLGAGTRFVQERELNKRMAEVKDLIRAERYDEALAGMMSVQEDLTALIELLLDRARDVDELVEALKRLEEFRDRVEELRERQEDAAEQSKEAERAQQRADEVRQARKELASLAQDQRELAKATAEVAEGDQSVTAALAERQDELKKRTDELVRKLEKLAEAAKGDAGDKAGDGEAGESDGEKKPGDGEAGDKEEEPAKPGEPKEGSPGDAAAAKAAGGACSACQSAAGKMGESSKKLGEGSKQPSIEEQKRALEKLAEADAALAELEGELDEKARRELERLPFAQRAREQEQLSLDTDDLAKEMEGEKNADGESEQPPAPGTNHVQQAVPKQKAAAGSLTERKPGDGKEKQEQAAEDLEKAQKELEDAIAQLRQQLQDEILRSLEERFVSMLAEQKKLTALTVATQNLRVQLGVANPDAQTPEGVRTRCAKIADGEIALASEADDALKLLQEDGSSSTFPILVDELRIDLEAVASRVERLHTARRTQGLQAEIEDRLRLMIDALRRQIEENEGGNPGSCNGQPALVPLTAEFRLLLLEQKRVNRLTLDYDERLPDDRRKSDEARDEAESIARKQNRVEELTRTLADKLQKDDQANDR